MAQTRKKRQTKHRGNAAGVVESRGRTGRPPTPEERKKANRSKDREDRLSRRPTWKQSFQRAAIAGIFVFVFLYVTNHPKNGDRLTAAIAFAVVVTALYIPGGFYLETAMWRRRMAKKQGATKR